MFSRMAKNFCWFIEFDSMGRWFLLFTQARFVLMHYLAILSHLRPRFAYTLGHYVHVRSHGGRQNAAVKPPCIYIEIPWTSDRAAFPSTT